MQKGDVVLITFPFTDLSGSKLRPAVILVTSDHDIIVCFITTQLQRREASDVLLQPSTSNGIKKLSMIKTNKIATLEKTLALGKIGELSSSEIVELNRKLTELLQL